MAAVTPVEFTRELDEAGTRERVGNRVELDQAGVEVSEDNPIPVGMSRASGTDTLIIAAGANVSDELDFTGMSALTVHMPGVWTAASIGFQVAPVSGGTFQPLYDQLGNLVQIAGPPVANRSYQSPPEIMGCRFVKLWSQNGVGVNVAQAAERSIPVSLKS